MTRRTNTQGTLPLWRC